MPRNGICRWGWPNILPPARAEHPLCRASDPDGKVTAVYLGLLETTRGIGELIDAIRFLRAEHGDKFRAVIIGSGRDSDFFVGRAREANILDNGITFLGRLPHDEAIRTVAGASLGIIPHHATESWNTTIPNKLFDYMAAGLPVVSSDAAPCVRVIREAACGEIFQSGNAASLAAAITRAAAPGHRRVWGLRDAPPYGNGTTGSTTREPCLARLPGSPKTQVGKRFRADVTILRFTR